MYDVTTSPNELLLFPLHHANVDRSALTWQHAAAAARPSLVAASWGYPTAATPTVVVNPGCRLHDVINSVAGFTRLFDTPPKNGSGYTHAEVLALTAPGKSPYLYDSQVEAH